MGSPAFLYADDNPLVMPPDLVEESAKSSADRRFTSVTSISFGFFTSDQVASMGLLIAIVTFTTLVAAVCLADWLGSKWRG